MTYTTEAPRREHTPDDPVDDYRETHPAFGCCVVTHWQSSAGYRLFGSDLVHTSGISLEFHEATRHRRLNDDRHHPGPVILKVDLSADQWARLVAAQGIGSGVPVTIQRTRTGPGVSVPGIEPPEITKKELHEKELADGIRRAIAQATSLVAQIGALIDGPGSVPKKELREIHHRLTHTLGNMPANTAFAVERFAEVTESTVSQAKIEIESFVAQVTQQLGVESLAALPRLPALQRDNAAPEQIGGGS